MRGGIVHGIASYIGSDDPLRMNSAAVLNSRQSKFAIGNDPWVRATVDAVDYVRLCGLTLLTSVDMNTWELTLALAAERHMPVFVVIPFSTNDNQAYADDLIRRFHLARSHTGCGFMGYDRGRSRKAGWLARDELIAEKANLLIPISIRPDGNLAPLIDRHEHVVRDFTAAHAAEKRRRPRYENCRPNPAIRDHDILIHFTRSTGAPWPDETEFDYYRALIDSGDEYCRSAANTLKHILDTGVIFGSGKNIRGKHRAVGFTHYSDNTCIDLFRYRPRLVNPYFEPYGIGIARCVAEELGIRPVLYDSSEAYDRLPDKDKPYYQNTGADGRLWMGEKEWRYVGDFDLNRVPADAVRVIVPTPADAAYFARLSPFAVDGLFENEVGEGS